MKWKEAKKHFFSFSLQSKIKRKNVYFVLLWSETKKSEAKQKIFGSKIKQKYAVLISLRSEAKNSKRKEPRKIFFHVTVQNACKMDLVSLWSETTFFGETGAPKPRGELMVPCYELEYWVAPTSYSDSAQWRLAHSQILLRDAFFRVRFCAMGLCAKSDSSQWPPAQSQVRHSGSLHRSRFCALALSTEFGPFGIPPTLLRWYFYVAKNLLLTLYKHSGQNVASIEHTTTAKHTLQW